MNARKCDDSVSSVHEFDPSAETSRKPQERYFEYIMRYSYRSKKGFIPNTQKFNQDAYIVAPNIGKKSWQHFFGICDGHGNNGHHVSSFIKNNLTQAVSNMPNLEKNPCDSLYRAYKSTVEKLTQ
jgi:serine/threonine protein phosphatase PrpC